MTLTPGTRLGLYEIVALLGEGGMGEVYRATDTKLSRSVAIKILPDAFASDGDRIARFEREAKALASLNHPHVAALHGFEEAGGRHLLVMELVEGETLAERLRRGPMTVDDTLRVAHQIADALEAAHEKGVVHRDLKPANVKITPEDRVKVLDFGLARLRDEPDAAARSNLSNSPTLGLLATQAGVILGTAAYMSPEQAKGAPADHRSDMFSFGSVLYEMLTGRQAFQADTPSEIMAAVLMREPDLAALPANLSPRLTDLVRRCLEKPPKRRWQAAGDLRAEIEAIMTAPRATVESAAAAASRKPLWRRAIPLAVTAIVSAAIVGGAIWWTRAPLARPAVVRLPFLLDPGQQFTNTAFRILAISPDGTQIVYAADGRLYLHAMAEAGSRPIPNTEQSTGVEAFSPDGRSIVFSTTDRALKRVEVGGGAAVTLGSVELPFSVSWGQDGILFSQPGAIMRVSQDGGKPETIVSLEPGERANGPRLLPDGQTLLFALVNGPRLDAEDSGDIVAQSLKSGARRTLVHGGSDARYLPSGHLVYALGGVLFAVPFNPARLEVTGAPRPVVEGVRRGAFGGASFSVSDGGSLVYVPGPATTSTRQQARLVVVDEKGHNDVLKLPLGQYESPRVAPDGKRIAFGTDDGKEANIWVYDLDGVSSPRRLTFAGKNRFPIWSADGRHVAFQSDREGDLAVFWQPADVSGAAERLTKPEPGMAHVPESWSHRDDLFSFSVVRGNAATLWTFSMRDKKATPIGDVRSAASLNSDFSPDGQWIAYTLRGGTSVTAIFVEPFPSTGAKYQIAREDLGHHPVWGPNGSTLFYAPGGEPLAAVSIATRPTFAVANLRQWPGRLPNVNPYGAPRNFDVMPNGRGFVFAAFETREAATAVAASPRIQVVLNWFEELKARVPATP